MVHALGNRPFVSTDDLQVLRRDGVRDPYRFLDVLARDREAPLDVSESPALMSVDSRMGTPMVRTWRGARLKVRRVRTRARAARAVVSVSGV